MDAELETLHPNDREAVARLAKETGRAVSDVVADLVHEALSEKGRRGEAVSANGSDPAYEDSKTELGRKLRALSRKYVESGDPLLSADEICEEVQARRGEVSGQGVR